MRTSFIGFGILAIAGAAVLVKRTGTKFALDSSLTSLISGEEGLRLEAYKDPGAGAWTIGWGHKIVPGDEYYHPDFNPNGSGKPGANKPILRERADTQLITDMTRFINCVNSSVKVELTKNQRNALISLTFNIGCAAFQESTLLRKLNAGDYSGASAEFDKWIFDDGKILTVLINRRNREQAIFNA